MNGSRPSSRSESPPVRLAANAASPMEAMRAGAEMFLAASTEPETQRIVLLDGPSVLGWDRWREIATEHGLGLIEATLQAAVDAGAIDPQPVRPLAHVLMGALDEAAMLVARAEDPEATRAEVGGTLDSLLAALSAGAPRDVGDADRGEVDSAAGTVRRDSFCAYIRTSASCSASDGSAASPGMTAAPQEAPTSTPLSLAVSAFAARRATASKRSRSQVKSTQNSSPPIR